ncbi:NUDIX hydrolase domain-like protein [Hypoxylon crocopeplum]|nr:NUDIX hydrolase domain-like protein [Hypoxylon crocopeplum]
MTGTGVPPLPTLNFDIHPAVSSFAKSQQSYLTKYPDTRYNYVATGAIIFNIADPLVPRILLIQRAASDSMPNRWEIPGGACDDEDESILYAVARELWEEAGLKAKKISRLVGNPYIFSSRSGKRICKYNFLVEAETNSQGGFDVTLDPREHQRFVWATKEDVETKRSADLDLDFTTKELQDTIIEAFNEIEKET